jgi:UDP-glucose 4-epimerase
MFEERLIDSYATNVIGFLQVLEFARSIGARKVIYASTSSIYGNNPLPLSEDQQVWPPNFYSVTKHAMEETAEVYHRRYGLELIGFRFMSVYGLREEHKGKFANLVSQFIWAMSGGRPPVIYGDGKQCRDFTNVKDVVRAVVLAMRAEERFGSTVFNVGTQEAYTLIEVADMINAVLGTHIAPQFIENPVKEGYVRQQQADIRKIQRALGFEPQVDLRAGIEEIVAALRAVDKKGCDGLAWVR